MRSLQSETKQIWMERPQGVKSHNPCFILPFGIRIVASGFLHSKKNSEEFTLPPLELISYK